MKLQSDHSTPVSTSPLNILDLRVVIYLVHTLILRFLTYLPPQIVSGAEMASKAKISKSRSFYIEESDEDEGGAPPITLQMTSAQADASASQYAGAAILWPNASPRESEEQPGTVAIIRSSEVMRGYAAGEGGSDSSGTRHLGSVDDQPVEQRESLRYARQDKQSNFAAVSPAGDLEAVSAAEQYRPWSEVIDKAYADWGDGGEMPSSASSHPSESQTPREEISPPPPQQSPTRQDFETSHEDRSTAAPAVSTDRWTAFGTVHETVAPSSTAVATEDAVTSRPGGASRGDLHYPNYSKIETRLRILVAQTRSEDAAPLGAAKTAERTGESNIEDDIRTQEASAVQDRSDAFAMNRTRPLPYENPYGDGSLDAARWHNVPVRNAGRAELHQGDESISTNERPRPVVLTVPGWIYDCCKGVLGGGADSDSDSSLTSTPGV